MPATSNESPHNTPHLKGVTGIILAGGKSTRFGSNKALVGFNGSTLIEKVVGIMSTIFREILIDIFYSF